MQLKQKEVLLDKSGNRKILVSEAGWDYSFRFSELEKAIEALLEKNPEQDKTFQFFCQNFYPLMASCVVGGDLPSPEEAFMLGRTFLDNWYLSFWELNEDIVGVPYVKEIRHEVVTFRDGTSLTIWESHGLPSFVLKLVQYENEALDHPVTDDPQGQMFYTLFYPKMAASCNGSSNIPDPFEVRNWARTEINKWLEASRRMNPQWYVITEEQKQEAAQEKRKKVRRRSAG